MGNWLTGRGDAVRIDRLAAVIGLALAIALFPLRFIATEIYIVTLPVILGVATALYLLADRRPDGHGLPTVSRVRSRAFPGIVFACTAALVTIAVQAGGRTPTFYLLSALTATVLLAQVFFTPESELSPTVVLVEALLLGLVIRFAGLTSTPGYVGIDVWTHMRFVEVILADRSLAPIADRKYYASPLFHLLVMAGVLLFESSLRSSLLLTAGLVTLVPIVLVYSLGRLLLVQRWALAAAVLYSVGDHFLRWGLHVIPTNLGLVFFCVFLLFFGRVVHTKLRPRDYLLLVGFSIAIVLTHQISTFIVLVVLFAGILARGLLAVSPFFENTAGLDRILSIPDPPKQTGLFLFNLGFAVFTWSLTPHRGGSFLTTLLSFFVDTVTTSAGFLDLAGAPPGGAEDQAPQAIVELVTYIDHFGFFALLFIAVVGFLYVLHGSRGTHLTLTLFLSAAVMLVFVLGLPLFGIRNFVPGRWFAFLYVPLVLLGLVGIRYLSRRMPGAVTAAFVLLLVAVLPGVMLVATPAVPDDPPFDRVQPRYAYTDSELAGVAAADRYLTDDEMVYTDHPYQTVVERRNARPAEPATVPANGSIDHDVRMYRAQQADGGVYFRDAVGGGYRRPMTLSEFCDPGMHHPYDNGAVVICRT